MKKTLIAASVGALMLAAAGTASANSLLFPYFTTAAGAQSVLSLSNTGAGTAVGSFSGAGSTPVHYVYNYGASCTHYDANGSLSVNDTLSHSIAAPAAGGFGLAIGSDKSVPVYFPLANQTGFLVVSSDVVKAGTTSTTPNTAALRGSMAIVDPATGLVVSYPGISNDITGGGTILEGEFSAIKDLTFALTALPSAFVTTSWYGNVVGNMNPAIVAGDDWKAAVSFSNGGNVWNNDEVSYSGTVTKTLNCAGTITPTDLVTSAQGAAVGPNGGLIKLTGTPVVASTLAAPTIAKYDSTGVVLMKMQAIQPATGGAFVGKQFLHREVAGFVAN